MANKIKVDELLEIEFDPEVARKVLDLAYAENGEDDDLTVRVDRAFTNEEKVALIMSLLDSCRYYEKYYVFKKED